MNNGNNNNYKQLHNELNFSVNPRLTRIIFRTEGSSVKRSCPLCKLSIDLEFRVIYRAHRVIGSSFANGHPTRCDSSLDHSLEYEQVDDKRERRIAFPHGKWSINSQQQIL